MPRSPSTPRRACSISLDAPYPTGRNSSRRRRGIRPTTCQNCGCGEGGTNMWRSNPDPQRIAETRDNMLCNACGLWRKEHDVHRPPAWWGRRRSSASPSPSSTSSATSFHPRLDVRRRRSRRGANQRPSSPSPAPNDKELGQDEMKEVAEMLLGLRMPKEEKQVHLAQHLRMPSPLYDRPAWLFNRPPPPVSAVPPPKGFLPPSVARSFVPIDELLNPSQAGRSGRLPTAKVDRHVRSKL
ncbi:hypothetical protein I204_08224 [Kwoniella mangroviensis CBS 8886]|uniref:uncharacterized protein n=1 Tax=Kwoniella mangroviensis CBS 8507 TaxID=1296122 RepID=UPI00080D3730|nr:uncharacterized protein I203_04415 [Kwoniella mangroviensis CBS 8507]OCF66090.1 hypothetical protein I203_04415 [Kwoniella mangroviensis CBS 8507]OCF71270.1 hypothetical protein I204_08224 [Kwoniella mangroviensis CBS 8886]